MKVPLRVGWLSENGLLERAGKLVGLEIDPSSANPNGVLAHPVDSTQKKVVLLLWGDEIQLEVAQLIELGFEPGTFEYCESCGKLAVDCARERAGFEEQG